MKTLILIFLTLLLSFLLSGQIAKNLKQVFEKISSPCNKPIHWKVDSVDKRFGITENTFMSDIQEASQVWDKPIARNLFVWDPNGTLSINLVFDERQSINNQINQLENQAQNEKSQIQPKLQEYEALSQDFKQRLVNLNNEVVFWNQRGGAPQDVYDRLTKAQKDLIQEADRLNAMAKDLNLSADQYNVTVNKLNGEIGTFNQTLQVRPEEGIYKQDENRIEIYFNINHNELVHTLAHEMGHTLGLMHINDPKAIMYPNTTQQITAASSDIASLKKLCHI